MQKELIKNFPLKDIKPYERNPRKNNVAVDYVYKSIKENGYITPIIVDDNFIILAGHTSLKALKKLNKTECDIIKVSGLTEKQKKDFRIRNNKSSELAEWDFEILKQDFEIPELECMGFDMQEDFGIEPKPDLKADIVPEIDNKNIVCKIGDMWTLGSHRLLCGDCTIKENVEKLMDGKKADMVLTDPPYGVNYSSKNEFLNKFDNGKRNQRNIKNDFIKNYRDFFTSFLRLIPFADYNIFYIFMGGKELHNLRLTINDCMCVLGDYLIWLKNNHILGRKDYNLKHEFIVYGWKGKHKFYGDFNTTILEFDKPLKSELHPTMKPVDLLCKLISDGSKKDFIIYDAFLGSGSTLIACEKTNRVCFGMEIDLYYCDVILQRWADYTHKDPVRQDGKRFSELKKYDKNTINYGKR